MVDVVVVVKLASNSGKPFDYGVSQIKCNVSLKVVSRRRYGTLLIYLFIYLFIYVLISFIFGRGGGGRGAN